jgi:hypothetical protein
VTRALRSSKPASEELVEAVRWYEAQRAGLGAEFYDAVLAALSLLESRGLRSPQAQAKLLEASGLIREAA